MLVIAPDPHSTAADPAPDCNSYVPVSVPGAAPLTFSSEFDPLTSPPCTTSVAPVPVYVPVTVAVAAVPLYWLPICTYPLLLNEPLFSVAPPLPPLPTSSWLPALTVVVPPTVSVFPGAMYNSLLLVMARLAALALARSSVTVTLDVLPMVTALELVGTPAVQLPATLQFPELVFQASAVAGVMASGLDTRICRIGEKLNRVNAGTCNSSRRPAAKSGDRAGTPARMSAHPTSRPAIA